MKPGPSLISAKILNTIALDSSPRSAVEIITEIILTERWCKSESEAREKAETWQKATLTRLQQELNALLEVGRPARFAFNSSSQYMIQGACFIEPKDSEELKDKKQRRSQFTEYYKVISTLPPHHFEVLCGKLIGLLGVENPIVTRTSSDEGIDFYGRLSLESIFFPHDLSPTVQKQLSIWLVGQAKRYQSVQAGTPEIRDLAGAIALGRAGAFGSLESPLIDLQIRVADPVFAMFITTGSLSGNAWRLLKRSGIIGMDGEMLAAFLADREVGMSPSGFQECSFTRWIEA
jgi:hypothetical protein